MAKSPDGRGVLLFGGSRGTSSTIELYESKIFELRTGANSSNFLEWNWNILDINLKHGRRQHTVIPLQ